VKQEGRVVKDVYSCGARLVRALETVNVEAMMWFWVCLRLLRDLGERLASGPSVSYKWIIVFIDNCYSASVVVSFRLTKNRDEPEPWKSNYHWLPRISLL